MSKDKSKRMRTIHLLSLIQAKCNLEPKIYERFLSLHDIQFKDQEVDDLNALIKLIKLLQYDCAIFDKFYVGYKIPQIGKEFDLLRIGTKTVINIELKSESSSDKAKKQLIKNAYYLSHINKKVYCFSFISSEKKLYQLEGEAITEANTDILINLLENQELSENDCINDFFNPSDYLVSPFNSPKNFVEKKYFLTQQQEDIKKR